MNFFYKKKKIVFYLHIYLFNVTKYIFILYFIINMLLRHLRFIFNSLSHLYIINRNLTSITLFYLKDWRINSSQT